MVFGWMRLTLSYFPEGGQCWMVGNHDYGRLKSRWTGVDANGQPYPNEFYYAIAALLQRYYYLYQGLYVSIKESNIAIVINP